MASNDEGQGSGDCDDIYRAIDEFLSLADDQPMLLLAHRLEAAGSTPTSTQPQQGMNINTPPTQLASGVGLRDSGRGKEEAPLVADDVAMDEDEDDDGTQQYVYTGAYLGFERHESVPELPSPEAERIMDDLPVVKKSRKRSRKGKKADSMIHPPQQPQIQDRIDIPIADKWHIPGQPIQPAAALGARFGDLRDFMTM